MSGSLIKIDNPFEPFKRDYIPIPEMEGRTIYSLIEAAEEKRPVIVLRNSVLVEDYNTRLKANDVIHIYPRIEKDAVQAVGLIALAVVASYVVSPYVTTALTPALGATGAGIAGGVAAAAVITAGGLLLNPGLSGGGKPSSSSEDSPTYHWDIDANPAKEGLAIPVIYGSVISKPAVINQWIEIDSSNDQWSHTLLLVAEGETNNEPTVDDIYVGDQLLSFYDADDYALVTTDGSASPNWGSNTDFTTPHQMRNIDRYLYYTRASAFILHFDGDNGSTTIEDDSDTANIWTCQNSADLTTSPAPIFGSASLDLTSANAYVSCDNEESFNIWTEAYYTIECWFRASVVDDHALMGQSRELPGADQYFWGLFIENGNSIVFNQFRRESGGDHKHYYYKSESATLNADTWYHICVQRRTNEGLRIYLDGERLGDAANTSNTRIDPPAGTWYQAIGKARLTNGVESSDVKYGDCYIDDARIIIGGSAYSSSSFDAPDAALPDDNNQEYIFTTKGVIDKFTLTFSFPYGIYNIQNDSTLNSASVRVQVAYRKTNTSDWTVSASTLSKATRNPYKEQETYTMPSRGKYDIRVRRLSKDDNDAREQTTLLLQYVDEFLNLTLTYPYLQCIGISLKAQELSSGRIPTYRVLSNRSLITAPDYGRDNTQSLNPTTNAYGAFDMLTNDVYGPGIDAARFDEDDWEDWADWTNTTVDGNKRAQLNVIFDSVRTVDEALQLIEDCGRARIIKRGTSFSALINKPVTASALFGAGNIVPQSDHVKWVRQAERSDAVEIVYRDLDLEYIEKTVQWQSSTFRSLSRQPRIVRLNMYGINNKDQAVREAILRQQINDSILKSVDFQSGLEAIPVTSGDVINYQASINSFTGRLPLDNDRNDEWTGTTVYLDQEINLDSSIFSGNCILMVRDPDDTLQSYIITGPFDTNTWTVTISSSGTFNQYTPYTICRNTGDVYQYKIEEMKRSSKLDIKISALQYDSTVYYNDNYESGSVAI